MDLLGAEPTAGRVGGVGQDEIDCVGADRGDVAARVIVVNEGKHSRTCQLRWVVKRAGRPEVACAQHGLSSNAEHKARVLDDHQHKQHSLVGQAACHDCLDLEEQKQPRQNSI